MRLGARDRGAGVGGSGRARRRRGRSCSSRRGPDRRQRRHRAGGRAGHWLLVAPARRSITRPAAPLPAVVGAARLGGESSEDAWTFAPTDVRHPVFRATAGTRWRSARVGAVPPGGAMARVGDTRQILARFSNGCRPSWRCPARAVTWSCSRAILRTRGTTSRCDPRSSPFVHDLLRYLAAGRPLKAEPREASGQAPEVIARVSSGWAGTGPMPGASRWNVDVREGDGSQLTPAAFLRQCPRPESGRSASEELQRDRSGSSRSGVWP